MKVNVSTAQLRPVALVVRGRTENSRSAKPMRGCVSALALFGAVTASVLADERPSDASETTMDDGIAVGAVNEVGSSPTSGSRPFDVNAARDTLESIAYKDCPGSGAGNLVVTFSPATGDASSVTVTGALAGNACIVARFMQAHVPPFDPPEKTVGWKVSL